MYADAALRIIAHPARASILRAISDREMTVGALARRLHLRQPATSQHLHALKQADLVLVRADANRRHYRANPVALAKLRETLAGLWATNLVTLKEVAERPRRRAKAR